MILLDGPLEGYELARDPGPCPFIVLPELDGDGDHFIQHTYTHKGFWDHSETRVGYESDETIARREAYWKREYWEEIEAGVDESFG